MANDKIILFGKPDSFESYELSANGIKRVFDSFIEPELKVSQNQSYIYHQFIIDGFSYLQIYSFAQAFQSGREGIVIGVAFKSDNLIELCSENFNVLKVILEKFKNKALEGIEFKGKSLNKTVQELYQEILSYSDRMRYSNTSPSKSINQSVLLFLPNLETSLKNLRTEINLLKDVYISSNKEVFTSTINIKYLYTLQNKFYTLNDENKIIEYVDATESEKIIRPQFVETETEEVKKLRNEVLTIKRNYDNLDSEHAKFKKITARRIKLLSIASVLLCLTTFSFFFKDSIFPFSSNGSRGKGFNGENSGGSHYNQTEQAKQSRKVSIGDILDNPLKLDSLSTLCKNIKSYKQKPSKSLYEIIKRDGNALSFDVSFIDKYTNNVDRVTPPDAQEVKRPSPRKTTNTVRGEPSTPAATKGKPPPKPKNDSLKEDGLNNADKSNKNL